MDAVAKESLPYSEWSKVRFGDCYNDDALWGFAIATLREQFLRQMDPREDEVLRTLIDMGVFNWEDPDIEGHDTGYISAYSCTKKAKKRLKKSFTPGSFFGVEKKINFMG